MKTGIRVTAMTFLFVSALAAPVLSLAQTASPSAPVAIFFTGAGNDMAVGQSTALPNPANCALHDAADITGTTNGYATFLATALTAITTGQNVTIVISNTVCSNSRPLMIGFNINP
jgi:hypothetical protein